MKNLPFMSASYLAIHEVTTVSLLRPSISGSIRIFFSLWCLEIQDRSFDDNASKDFIDISVKIFSYLKCFSRNILSIIHKKSNYIHQYSWIIFTWRLPYSHVVIRPLRKHFEQFFLTLRTLRGIFQYNPWRLHPSGFVFHRAKSSIM